MRRYKIAIAGAGRWAEVYARTISNYFPQIDVVAVLRQKNTQPNFLPNAQVHTDIDSFFYHHIRLDGIIVATDNPGDITKECLEYGVPVLAEKPLITDSRQLLQWKKDYRILVNYTHLFSPAFQKLQEIVNQKEILGIYSEGYNKGPHRSHFSSLWDYGVHDMAMILTLVGIPSEVKIKEKRENSGSLYDILLTYSRFYAKSLVGNGEKEKSRNIQVLYEEDGEVKEARYDDLSNPKLTIDDKEVEISSTQPLIQTIDSFLRLIEGEEDPRFGLELTRKITEILSQHQKQM